MEYIFFFVFYLGWRPSWLVYRSAKPFGGRRGKEGGGTFTVMALAHSWTAQCSETQFSLLHAQKPEEAQCLAAWKFDRKVCGTGGTTRMCFRYRHHCKLLCFSTFYNINEKTVVWRDRRVCVKLTSVFFVHWFISTLSHTHILVCVVGVCVCVCVECGLGNWNEQWWLSDSKKKMETTLLDAPDYYSLLWNFVSKLPNGKNVFDLPNIFQKCLCEKQSWSYTDFIGGLDVEKSPTTHKIFYYCCCWVSYLKKKNPSPSRLSCLRRWVYFFLGGGTGEEGHFFSPLLTCKSISIVKVATEDGSGFGGDCRGSR
jgi:hypothetical protein